ncbi:hypothetical protein TWF481_010820 [Arthrobotrys musiformis]|uniref:F-box domain-containing protein n=1 Tax=Arthrobotrys musiformis TaxID=47236 RepID=A0AAV9W1Z3_9PEZI
MSSRSRSLLRASINPEKSIRPVRTSSLDRRTFLEPPKLTKTNSGSSSKPAPSLRSLFSSSSSVSRGRSRKPAPEAAKRPSGRGILDLPPEVVQYVLSYSDISILDRINLSRTCSGLHFCVLQSVYKNFELHISYRREPQFKLLVHKKGNSEVFNTFNRYKHMIRSLRVVFEDVTSQVAGHSRTLYRNGEYTYSELELDELFWLLSGCGQVRSFGVVTPKDSPFNFNIALKLIQNAISNIPRLDNLNLQCRPCKFDLFDFLDGLVSEDEMKFATLDSLSVSLHGLVDGNPANDKIFEALYMALGSAKDHITNLQLAVATDDEIPKAARCCGLHRPFDHKQPMLDVSAGVQFPRVYQVELGVGGIFKCPERWLGVDYYNITKLVVRSHTKDHIFDIKAYLGMWRFQNVKVLELYYQSDNRNEETVWAFAKDIIPLFRNLSKAKVGEAWSEVFRYCGVKSAALKTSTAVYMYMPQQGTGVGSRYALKRLYYHEDVKIGHPIAV